MEKAGNKVIIIGGGASGMVAAISARRNGADVTILEKNPRIGRKILATGNGRCNLTNINMDVSYYHGRHPEFVLGAFSRFDYNNTIDFFEELGIAHKVEDGGKVFPISNQASSVLDVLRYDIENSGIEVVCDANVVEIKKGKSFKVTVEDGRYFSGDRVIIAAGGKASPDLGSNGSGYKLARSMGHTIVEPFPALVQLKLSSKYLKQLQGIKFDGDAEVIVNGSTVRVETGEILFTEYGISGPPIIQLSRRAAEYLKKGDKVYIKVVVVNNLAYHELDEMLANRIKKWCRKAAAV